MCSSLTLIIILGSKAKKLLLFLFLNPLKLKNMYFLNNHFLGIFVLLPQRSQKPKAYFISGSQQESSKVDAENIE